jgi:hypothetical protein
VPTDDDVLAQAAAWETLRVVRDAMPRDGWGQGPWEDEPDFVLWMHHGVRCMIWRNDITGSLNGYVEVSKRHPFYQNDYSKIAVRVHGGLTFAGPLSTEWARSHEVEPGSWWIGFDCGHAFDYKPGLYSRVPEMRFLPPMMFLDGKELRETYRAIGYVRAETEALASQVVAAELN